MNRHEYGRCASKRRHLRRRFPLRIVHALFGGRAPATGRGAALAELWDLLVEAIQLEDTRAQAGLRASRSLLLTMRRLEGERSPVTAVRAFRVPRGADGLQEVA